MDSDRPDKNRTLLSSKPTDHWKYRLLYGASKHLRGCPLSAYRRIRGGRRDTAPQQTWSKPPRLEGNVWIDDETPLPGHTYTRATWPPRGQGRGESLSSPRRIEAK